MRGMNTSRLEFPNRREVCRVYYPVTCIPKYVPSVVFLSRTYRVLDISEKGIRFLNPHFHLIPIDTFSFTVKFPDEADLELEGKVVRRTDRQVAIKLSKEIPYSRIMSEQQRLRRLELQGIISYIENG